LIALFTIPVVKSLQKLELQLQAIAKRDIAHGFLGHSYQSHFSNL